MSGFDLVPVDGEGGDPIHLPPGETALGRGPLLGVSDKRVSRHHGVLENLNGQLRLKPTHLNPCFVQSSPTDDPQPLQRDAWHLLHHGDLFSLLPGQFIYRVVAVAGEDITPRNGQRFEEEEEVPVLTNPDTPDQGQTPPPETSNQEEADRRLNEKVSEVDNEQSDAAPPATRRRVLPAWMMVAAAAVHGSPSGLRAEPAAKRRKTPAAASTSTKRAAAAAQTKTASPEEAELREEGMPKKRRRKICKEEEAQTKTEAPSVRPQRASHRSEVSNESDSFTMEVDDEGRGGETSADDVDTTSQRAESAGSDSGSTSRPALSKPRVRKPCPYGKDCYRKNPIHFRECSHPGDTDYEEEEETEEADRPECPYGTDCYRKNPLHRKEYKHTKKPASSTRTLRRKPPGDKDDDEDDDLGDNDSFINDDSEDVGDDSDYAPPDSDDSGKEDVNRLQKEAKAFLRRK